MSCDAIVNRVSFCKSPARLYFCYNMNKEIFRLAIPNIIANITVPLLGMVDMFIAGHLYAQESLASIGVAATIFNLIYWNFSFLRMGTSGFTSQAYGANNKPEQVNSLMRSLTVAIIAGLLIVMLQSYILKLGFFFVDTGDAVRGYATAYFSIYIWAAPAILCMYTLTGWYVGMQNTRIPMYVAIGVNVVNIALSFVFIYGVGMQIEGIAYATLFAQYTGLVTSLLICYKQNKGLIKSFNPKVWKDLKGYYPFFRVNSNIFIRTLALVAVTTCFMSASAKIGDDILSLNTVMMQFFILFSYMMDGFAYAAEALTGKLVGSGDRGRLRLLVRRLFLWGFCVALLFTTIYALFSESIFRFLTDKDFILDLFLQYQIWLILIPLAGFSAFLWDGIFVGATASRQMRNSMLIAAAAFFIVYAFILLFLEQKNEEIINILNNILWFAFILYLALRGAFQSFMARSILKESK